MCWRRAVPQHDDSCDNYLTLTGVLLLYAESIVPDIDSTVGTQYAPEEELLEFIAVVPNVDASDERREHAQRSVFAALESCRNDYLVTPYPH